MSYGDRLKQALAAKAPHKTRVGLAAAIGVSPQAVGQVIRGETRAFTAENNAKAAAYLDCNPNWLATGLGSMNGVVPPPIPPRNFEDRHAVSASDWATLQDVKILFSDAELADMRLRAERLRQQAMVVVAGKVEK